MRAEKRYGSFQQKNHRLRGSPCVCTSSAKDQEGLDHVCGAEHGGADVTEDLDALGLGEATGGEELGVGVDGREVVREIVRDRACLSADGGEPLGFEQRLVGLLNLVAHAGKGIAKLTNLARAVTGNTIVAVAHAEGPHAFGELLEGTSEKTCESNHQQGA